LQEKLNVGSKEVFKAGSALAGGVARRGETCGALTGAIMGVCSVVGRERLEDREQYGKAMEEADGFVTFLGIKLATRFVNRSIRFAMVRSIVLSALKREKPFTGMVDTAGKDAPRFGGLLPGSPLKSSLISRRSQLNLYPGRFIAHPGEGRGQIQSNIPSSNKDHVLDLL
jgi:hypothetical protein